jgi:hypothetical protein
MPGVAVDARLLFIVIDGLGQWKGPGSKTRAARSRLRSAKAHARGAACRRRAADLALD